MGDVRNRGTDHKPQWYCRYIDVDGKRKQRATKQQTETDALRYLAEIEARIAREKAGVCDVPECYADCDSSWWTSVDADGNVFVRHGTHNQRYAPIAWYEIQNLRDGLRFVAHIHGVFDGDPEVASLSKRFDDEREVRGYIVSKLGEICPPF